MQDKEIWVISMARITTADYECLVTLLPFYQNSAIQDVAI